MKMYETIEASSLQEYNDKLNELADKGYRAILSSVNFNSELGKLDYFCATMQLDPQQQQTINADKSLNRMVRTAVNEIIDRLQNNKEDSE